MYIVHPDEKLLKGKKKQITIKLIEKKKRYKEKNEVLKKNIFLKNTILGIII